MAGHPCSAWMEQNWKANLNKMKTIKKDEQVNEHYISISEWIAKTFDPKWMDEFEVGDIIHLKNGQSHQIVMKKICEPLR